MSSSHLGPACGCACSQYEAAWAITNIAGGTTDHARDVLNEGALTPLLGLFTSSHINLREQVRV